MSAEPDTLLPPSSTPLERALSRTAGRFDPPRLVPALWNADICPVSVLPFLAWSLSVDEWDSLWAEEKKREVIKAAHAIHQKKGTPLAIHRALSALGHPDAVLIERSDYLRCDGSVSCDGSHTCGGQWASFRVRLLQPITIGEAYLVKRTLLAVGRNAVHLQSIDFNAAAFRCDGTIICNGDYSCGSVNTTIN